MIGWTSRLGMALSVVALSAAGYSVRADPPASTPGMRSMHLEIRMLGPAPYQATIQSDSQVGIPLVFQAGPDGVAIAKVDLTLASGDDGRDQRTLVVQRPGVPGAEATLPLSIITYAAPLSASFDIPDLHAVGCTPKPSQGGGETYWVSQYLQSQVIFRVCKQEGPTSQKTLDAMDDELAAHNRLTDLDPVFFSANDSLVTEAQALLASADLCTGRPAVECTNINQEITWANAADYKLLTVAQRVEAHSNSLSDTEIESALKHINTGKDAFIRCKSGDLKDKCGPLHTNETDYSRTLRRFCMIAAGRGISALEDDYRCPKF